MRDRYVLRYRGDGETPDADIERIRSEPAVTIVRQTPRMLLVESEEGILRQLVGSSLDWVMVPERSVDLPHTRKQVRRPPS